MKILIFAPTVNSATGSVRRLGSLAAGLASLGHGVCMATTSWCEVVERIALDAGVSYLCGHRFSRYGNSTRRNKLLRALALTVGRGHEVAVLGRVVEESGPLDLAIARNALGVLALSPHLKGIPLVWDVGIETQRFAARILLSRAATNSAAIITQSRAQADAIAKASCRKALNRTHVLLPGLINYPGAEYIRPSWLPRGRVILHVASIHPRKNQLASAMAFARAFNSTKLHSSEVCLVFIGGTEDKRYEGCLRSWVNEHKIEDRVHFLGWRDDARQAISHADLLVLPSRDEGVSNVLQEAMLAGIPVAASNVGGTPDLIRHGVTGWLYGSEDYETLATLMREAIVDANGVARVISKAGQRFAEECFQLEGWVGRYEEVLQVTRSRVVDG